MKYEGIIFDMDGTLTEPAIDFIAVRRELGIPLGQDIVKVLAAWSDEEAARAWKLIEKYEDEVRYKTVLQAGS